MRTLYLAAAALGLGLAACGYNEDYNNQSAAYSEDEGNYSEGAAGTEYASTDWPEGARIVVEDDVTYRILPSGERIVLGPNDSRIVVEDGTRFRVDPGGTRVRIDEQGAVIRVDEDGISATVNNQ